MITITVQAVYHKGALRPKKKLDIPEDALVQVQVTQLAPASTLPDPEGAFPALDLSYDEVEVQVTPLASGPTGFAALKGIWSHLSDQQVEQAIEDLHKTRQ